MEDDGTNENLITYYLWVIISPILLTFGTIGNVLSIAVLSKKGMRSSSASVYLIALALADMTVILTGLLRQFVRYISGIDVRDVSNIGCKVSFLLVYASLDTSVWILVAFTFERVLSVFTPHKVKSYCTRMTSILIIVGIVVIMMALNGHLLFGFGDKTTHKNSTAVLSKCDYLSNEYDDFFANIFPWIDYSVYSLIPFIILIIANSCIVVRLMMRRRNTRRIAGMEVTPNCAEVHVATVSLSRRQASTAPPRTSQNSSMTVILLVLNLVFLITTAPIGLFAIIEPSWVKTATTNKDLALVDLAFAVVSLIMYTNNSINFILYCVTGSRFRKEFMNIFRKQRKWKLSDTIKTGQSDEPLRRDVITARLTTDRPQTSDTAIPYSEVHNDRLMSPAAPGEDN